MPKSVFSSKVDIKDEKKLKQTLEKDGFVLEPVDHAFWQAKKDRVFITFYRSGKVVIRGKNIDGYADKYLGELKTNQEIHGLEKVHNLREWIGTDESGKGDFFGPLVVAALYVDKKLEHKLWQLGVQDSKKITDSRIVETAKQIRRNFTHSVVTILPMKYNQIYEKYRNLNKLLAYAHAQAIKNLMEKTSCRVIIADKFGDEKLIYDALGETKDLTLIQRNKAEANLAVAGASILAREKFVTSLDSLTDKYGLTFPPGASSNVITAGRRFIQKYGQNELKNVAKLHFKTTKRLVE
ncbi:ribonuclease HIII [candidate division KSB1 bacterium 4572_119]|nr:MAG: ribonuclease HIII [candidate division KSB1 bacterium 4572_119]